MIVYELIKQLTVLPPDMEVTVLRVDQAKGRQQRILSISTHPSMTRVGRGVDSPRVGLIITDWES